MTNFFSTDTIVIIIFFIGAVFLVISMFDRNLPMGSIGRGSMYVYRGRGGIVSFSFLLAWVVLFIAVTDELNLVKLLIGCIVGVPIGTLFYRLFLKYNQRFDLPYEKGRPLSRENLIGWGIVSLIISLFPVFFVWAFTYDKPMSLVYMLLTYLFFVPIVALIGARTNWSKRR